MGTIRRAVATVVHLHLMDDLRKILVNIGIWYKNAKYRFKVINYITPDPAVLTQIDELIRKEKRKSMTGIFRSRKRLMHHERDGILN